MERVEKIFVKGEKYKLNSGGDRGGGIAIISPEC
jgi:hypothetical protein